MERSIKGIMLRRLPFSLLTDGYVASPAMGKTYLAAMSL